MDYNTLIDLNIISVNDRDESLLNSFDFTKNDKAKEKLRYFLLADICNKAEILSFHKILYFVIANIQNLDLNITNSDNYYLEEYLKYDKVLIKHNHLYDKTILLFKKSIKYYQHINFITSGVIKLIILLIEKWTILKNLEMNNCPLELKVKLEFITSYLSAIGLKELKPLAYSGDIPFFKILELDYQFRIENKDSILKLLDLFYEMEALVSISKATKKYSLVFPEINETNTITINGLFHPFVKKCVKNTLAINETENLYFLTGPNMSGKSTFLKSIGLTLYLALRGFGVPAERASIPLFDEVIISINSRDDIFSGDSYFISELKRVKEIAIKLQKGKKCFVIFDELFKGTNFIDSLECSKLVILGLSAFSNSKFIISTHMVPLYEEIKKCASVSPIFLETLFKGEIPFFTYKLKQGVSNIRLGVYLLEKEGIKELLPIKL